MHFEKLMVTLGFLAVLAGFIFLLALRGPQEGRIRRQAPHLDGVIPTFQHYPPSPSTNVPVGGAF